jgi:hypothetical protein
MISEAVQTRVCHAVRWNGRLAQRSATALYRSKVPFVTAVRTFSIRCVPLGNKRICCFAPIQRWSGHWTRRGRTICPKVHGKRNA